MDADYLGYLFGDPLPEGGLAEAESREELIAAFLKAGIDLSGLQEAEIDHVLAELAEKYALPAQHPTAA